MAAVDGQGRRGRGKGARQQRIRGDVEGHAQPQVARALVQLARQLALRHIELQQNIDIHLTNSSMDIVAVEHPLQLQPSVAAGPQI